jgi:ribulose-phosphate 3-epimerase
MKNYVSPSLLAANKSHLFDEIKTAEEAGAEYIHWDIMDGKFVPNVSFKAVEVKAFSKVHKMVNDVHIMVADPAIEAPLFVGCGANLVTFHIEAVNSLEEATKIIDKLHSLKCQAGISIKPATKVDAVLPLLEKVDLVLVMSVEPGKGGQKFMPMAVKKIKKLRKFIDKNRLNCLIEVDGGINDKTGKKCRKAGADILVAGSYLFGHDDFAERVGLLR